MKKLMCLLMTLMMIFGLMTGSVYAESDSVEQILSSMSLRDKITQMMIVSFRVWQEVPPEGEEKPEVEPPKEDITELNEPIREMLGRDHFGAFLLYRQNFVDAEQTLRFMSDIQSTNQAGGGLPQIFMTDQEGGYVYRIPYGTIGVGNMALGATGDPETARTMARIHGEELALLGIHANFAPVVDINNNAANPVIGNRSFSDDPETVATFSCAYMKGLQDTGTMAALKHFPGHGNTDTDSHTGLPLINSTYEELKNFELIPFQAAIDAGADMVMTAHIQYPQIEKETYTSISTGKEFSLPATMSRTIITDILREEMGFDGVIVSDALDMAAISDNFTIEDTIRLTIRAGLDMWILPTVIDTNIFRQVDTWVDTAVALAESGEISEERINESVRRILKLKEKYGILDQTDFTVTESQISAAREGIGSRANFDTEWEIAEKALTLIKNENGAFPLNVKAGEKTLMLFSSSCASRMGNGDLVIKLLKEKQALPEGAEIIMMKSALDNEDACIQAAKEADHVILVHRVWNQENMDPANKEGFSSGTFDKVITALHDAGKTVIVVSCQLPYDAARFPDADAILLTYWGSPLQTLPAEGEGWSSNLPAGLLACFGEAKTGGKLPVNIPALDDHYQPSSDIFWFRGEPETAFENWNQDAPSLEALIEYVEDVTDKYSPNYIPPKDRIATFDMDGTLVGELMPTYLRGTVLMHRIFDDPTYTPDEEMKEYGHYLRDCVINNSIPKGFGYEFSIKEAKAFAGLTLNEYYDNVTQCLLQEADGFEGMTYANAFYLPMVDVVEYLNENDFICYVVSGTDRSLVRAIIEGVFDIPAERIIGSDVALEARDQGDTVNYEYDFTPNDILVRTDKFVMKNVKMTKVEQIALSIGRQPVLSFGNSSGDTSMHNYALYNNRYRSAAFQLIADDDVRDYGNSAQGPELREKWEKMGYTVISMRDDWKTIYGEDVVKTGSFHWAQDYAD